MVTNPKTIRVTPETDLPTLLDDAAQGPVLLERVRRILDETVGGWADLKVDAVMVCTRRDGRVTVMRTAIMWQVGGSLHKIDKTSILASSGRKYRRVW